MMLAWLFSTVTSAYFGWHLIATVRQLNDTEVERDALWDELHGIGPRP